MKTFSVDSEMAYPHHRSQFGDTTLTKVFVGGLAWNTPTEELRQYFEQFGEILEAVVILDKATGKSKGYGFVTFRDPESARMACADPNPVIDGRRANCNIASFGRTRPSPPPGGSQSSTPFSTPALPPPPPPLYPHYGYSPYAMYNPPQYYPQMFGSSSQYFYGGNYAGGRRAVIHRSPYVFYTPSLTSVPGGSSPTLYSPRSLQPMMNPPLPFPSEVQHPQDQSATHTDGLDTSEAVLEE